MPDERKHFYSKHMIVRKSTFLMGKVKAFEVSRVSFLQQERNYGHQFKEKWENNVLLCR